jgi:hypothetical protein
MTNRSAAERDSTDVADPEEFPTMQYRKVPWDDVTYDMIRRFHPERFGNHERIEMACARMVELAPRQITGCKRKLGWVTENSGMVRCECYCAIGVMQLVHSEQTGMPFGEDSGSCLTEEAAEWYGTWTQPVLWLPLAVGRQISKNPAVESTLDRMAKEGVEWCRANYPGEDTNGPDEAFRIHHLLHQLNDCYELGLPAIAEMIRKYGLAARGWSHGHASHVALSPAWAPLKDGALTGFEG